MLKFVIAHLQQDESQFCRSSPHLPSEYELFLLLIFPPENVQYLLCHKRIAFIYVNFFIHFRYTINYFLCLSQLGFCSVYILFVARNLQEVVDHYFENINVRVILLVLLLPIILLNFLKNLKYLVPVSLFASILTLISGSKMTLVTRFTQIHVAFIHIPFFRYFDCVLLHFTRSSKFPYKAKSSAMDSASIVFWHCCICFWGHWQCTSTGKQYEASEMFPRINRSVKRQHGSRCNSLLVR